jgi:phosphoenolpyruvate carboxykinase (GTP)
MGATVASETTAAAPGEVGIVRRDPLAMKPFCGYHFAEYWTHWLSFEEKAKNLPEVFTVNWFRKNENNKFMWPGFGENMRVLEWIVNRVSGNVNARSTAIGDMPIIDDFNFKGMDFNKSDLAELLNVDPKGWENEIKDIKQHLDSYGERVPADLYLELNKISDNI